MFFYKNNSLLFNHCKLNYNYFYKFFSKFFFKYNFNLCYFLPKYVETFSPFFFIKLRILKINRNYITVTKVFFKKFPENIFHFTGILLKNKVSFKKKPYLYIKNSSYNYHKLLTYLI